jgi:hypothetical protein
VWRAGERRGWEDAQEVVEDDERVSIRDRVCVVGKLGGRHAGDKDPDSYLARDVRVSLGELTRERRCYWGQRAQPRERPSEKREGSRTRTEAR